MPCVSPDGKPTKTGLETLKAVRSGASTPQAISSSTGQPMFRIRSGLRELVSAKFLLEKNGKYTLTQSGLEIL